MIPPLHMNTGAQNNENAIPSLLRRGYALSKKLMESFPEAVIYTSGSWREKDSGNGTGYEDPCWTCFCKMDALVFVMASG